MQSLKDLTIGVLRGGISPEREISLLSGNNVIEALRRRGYRVVDLDVRSKQAEELIKTIKDRLIDLAFIALHGEFGEDGGIQKILEENKIPFTGADSFSSYLSMDKIKTRAVLSANNIPYPAYWVVDQGLPDFSPADFPLVVKPHSAGSSIGVSIIGEKGLLDQAVEKAGAFSSRVIVEKYIKGRELTVGIIGDKVLPVVEMVLEKPFFDFSAKYSDNGTRFVVPAKLPENIYQGIQELAYKVYRVLGCRHLGRVDLKLDQELNPYILELNSIPGLTPHSLLPLAARKINIGFEDLCEEVLRAVL